MRSLRIHRGFWASSAVVVLAVSIAACGGDDSGSDDTGSEDTQGPAEVTAVEAVVHEEADPGCPVTDVSFTNEAAGLEGTVTTALARSSFDGGLYEVHVADFDITADDLRRWRPEVPEGAHVITVQLTVFNASDDPTPIEPGTSLEVTIEPDERTFLVRHFTTDDDWSAANNIGTETVGTLTVTAVGNTFCFDIDYRDQDKTITGSVAAPVFEQL